MKRTILLTALACSMAVLATGCSKGDMAVESEKSSATSFTDHGNLCLTKVVQIEGHDYIIFNSYHTGCIVHAESCHCKKGF